MKTSGFSLLEITISISILAMIMGLGFYLVSYYDRLFVHLELNRLYALFRTCSAQALLLQTTEHIMFSAKNSTYTYHNTVYQLSPGVEFGILPDVQGPPANPDHAIASPITFVKNRASMYRDGRIQPGTIYLTDTKKRWLYAITCSVGHISYLRRYRYLAHEWVLLP